MVPIPEELAFGAVLPPSLAEDLGIIPALIISSAVFAVFHFAVYGASPYAMLIAFLFKFVANFLILTRFSLTPGLLMHATVNTLSVIFG